MKMSLHLHRYWVWNGRYINHATGLKLYAFPFFMIVVRK
jgi:hypothetical protein